MSNGESRPVKTATPYFLPLSIPLTGLAAETVFSNSSDPFTDLQLLGGTTDLNAVQVKFSRTGGRNKLFSADSVPIATLFGRVGSVRPVQYWPRPYPLKNGQRIDVETLNVNGEGAGTIVFHGRQMNEPAVEVGGRRDNGETEVISIDSQFTGTLSELQQTPSPANSFDFLLDGFYSDLTGASVRITGVQGKLWMRDFVPLWALASRLDSDLPVFYLRAPYLIPANQQIQVEFRNDGDEDGGQLYLVGQRLQ